MTTQTETPIDATVNDDLQRLAEFAQLVTAARDALSDDMVTRLSGALSEGMNLLDRLTRNAGLMRLLQVLDRDESQYLLIALSEAIHATSRDIAASPPATGGLGCMLRVARDPGAQEGVRLLAVLGQHLSHSLREQHRRGGA
ncbi:MAG: hypothetical protein ACYCZQ_07090 [Burkholderiales bacterium]